MIVRFVLSERVVTLSVTLIVADVVPIDEGVPLTMPLDELRNIPLGRVPPVIE